jgi:Cellulose binding domain
MQKLRRFVAHWKLLIIPIAVVAVGLAIALPISMASARGTTGSIPARSGRVEHAHTTVGPGAGCVVSYTATNWPGAFTAKVTISNRGSTSIDGWTLGLRFPGDEAISSAWNATFTQTGAEVSARNTNYDATIPPGGQPVARLPRRLDVQRRRPSRLPRQPYGVHLGERRRLTTDSCRSTMIV